MSDSVILCSKCGDSQPRFQSSAFENIKAYTADNVDRALVAALAAQVDSELQTYDGQIKRVEEILKELREEREKALEYRDRCRYLISAVRRVPPETWLDILVFACLEEDNCRWKNPAVRLASVCRQWREISLSSPAFWTTFRVDLRERHVTSQKFLQLHRERSLPLNLSIRARFPDLEDCCPDCSEITDWSADPHMLPRPCSSVALQFMLAISDRVSSFQFDNSYISMLIWIRALGDSRSSWDALPGFPNLQTLKLGSGDWYSDFGEGFDLSLFSRAVNLRHLSLSSYSGECCPSGWTQVMTMNLRSVEITVVHRLLTQCPNVIQADISAIINWRSPAEFEPCVQSSLLSLRLYLTNSTITPLLTSLTLPALQSLEIGADGAGVSDVLALCERSSFPLRHLSIEDDSYDAFNKWENLFLALPGISSFKFSGYPVSEEFIDRLTPSNHNNHPLFPRLAKFDLRCYATNVDLVLTMLESRLSPQIAKSHITQPTDVTIHIIVTLQYQPGISPAEPPLLLDPSVMNRVEKLADSGSNIKFCGIYADLI
ncbi:hypothetical protein C8J56DRAFT_1168391 [Mycena floridula]|nr:hypothetical protein C8J56DRAFT_1168391 [Mycena floridula]